MSRDMGTSSNSERLFVLNGGKNQTTLDIDCIRFNSKGCWAESCQECWGMWVRKQIFHPGDKWLREDTDTPWRSFTTQTGSGRKQQCSARSYLECGYLQSVQTFVSTVPLPSSRGKSEYNLFLIGPQLESFLPWPFWVSTTSWKLGLENIFAPVEFKSFWYNVAVNKHFLKELSFICVAAV